MSLRSLALVIAVLLGTRTALAQESADDWRNVSEDPVAPNRTKRKVDFSAELDVGGAARWLYGDPLFTIAVKGGVGFRVEDAYTFHGELTLEKGWVKSLDARLFRTGPALDFVVTGRLHLGVGLTLGGLAVERATGGSFGSFLLGASGYAACDVLRDGPRAIDVKLGFGIDAVTSLGGGQQNSAETGALFGPLLTIGAHL